MVIRLATAEDADLIARLNAIVQEIHVTERPDQFSPTAVEDVSAWLRPLLLNARVHVWIAESSGVAAGYVSAAFHDRPATPFTPARRWCEMDQIAVDPAWRRRGVARALIGALVANARTEGIRQIEAVSWSFNDGAAETLRRVGFTPKLQRFELVLGDERSSQG
jgi:GNAT superfamily N-acetyltransferase